MEWFQGITRLGLAVVAKLMETLLWYPPVTVGWVVRELDEVPAPPALALKPGRQFSSSLNVPGAFQAAVP